MAEPIGAGISGFLQGFGDRFAKDQQLAAERSIRAGQVLYEAAKKDPSLFREPVAAKAIQAYVGGKEQFEMLRQGHEAAASMAGQPDYEAAKALNLVSPQEQTQVQALEGQRASTLKANAVPDPTESPFRSVARSVVGALPGIEGESVFGPKPVPTPQLPVPRPYKGFQERLMAEGPAAGASVTRTEKGGTSVTLPGKPIKAREEALTNAFMASRRDELIASGISPAIAHLQAATDAADWAESNSYSVPKSVTDIRNAPTMKALERAQKAWEKQLELSTAEELSRKQRRGGMVGETEGRMKGPEQPLSEGDKTSFKGIQDGIYQASRVYDLYAPQLLGPLKGRFTSMKQYLGKTNQDEEQFLSAIRFAIDSYRRSTTGQAAAEQELNRIEKNLMNVNNTPEQFIARLTELATFGQNQHRSMSQILKVNNQVVPELDIPETFQKKDASAETPKQPAGIDPSTLSPQGQEFMKAHPELFK